MRLDEFLLCMNLPSLIGRLVPATFLHFLSDCDLHFSIRHVAAYALNMSDYGFYFQGFL